ncbi:MAG: LptE family protein [Ilyomonas sp.]
MIKKKAMSGELSVKNRKASHLLLFTIHYSTFIFCLLPLAFCLLTSCGVYTFKDVSIPPEVKTVRVSYIENKARYVNPQLSSQLTDQLKQKITNQTRLTSITADNADYQISGQITSYNVGVASISGTQTNANRLTVGVHIIFRNALQDKTTEFDVSRDFDFSGQITLAQAEAQLLPDIVKNLSDEIFNRIFSNW